MNAINRLGGFGGDPVLQLQTNFGGGKTHSMLALYHLFSGTPPADLVGVDGLMRDASVTKLAPAKRVVLVGNKRPPAVRRFHGSVALDPERLGRDAGRIAEEIVQHLTTQKGATVSLTLEIEADLPEGASESAVRTVTENARTLKFRVQGFEAD